MMTHRERVVTAINHGTPDVMPFDIGGTYASGINIGAYEALKTYLGITTPSTTKSRRSATAQIEPAVRERLGLDTWPIFPRSPFSAQGRVLSRRVLQGRMGCDPQPAGRRALLRDP